MHCKITAASYSRLRSFCEATPDRECCGLLAGNDGVITRIFAATNAASDPAKNYEIAPRELFRLMREIRAARLELLGIYHSHPNGKNEPSAHDIELAYYPGTAYFILSPLADASARSAHFPFATGVRPNYKSKLSRACAEVICSNTCKSKSKARADEAAQHIRFAQCEKEGASRTSFTQRSGAGLTSAASAALGVVAPLPK